MDKSIKITLIICVTVLVAFVLFLIFNPLKGESLEQKTTVSTSQTSPTQTPVSMDNKQEEKKITQPDAENYPWNAGERVPDKILADPLAVGDIPTNTIGGFGVQYENESKTSLLVFLFDDSLKKVQASCEGGGIRNADTFIPEIKGSWPSGTGTTWIPEQMKSEDIGGRKCWIVRGIDIKDYAYHQLGLVIFIGYSRQGGPKESPNKGWDKWLFDQRERARMIVVPGTYTNGGGGANCWFKVK